MAGPVPESAGTWPRRIADILEARDGAAMPTADRHVLERIMFRALAADAAESPIRLLFVGCSRYTAWYPALFADSGLRFETIDMDPAAAAFGAPAAHHVGDLAGLAERPGVRGRFDVLILNGIFGYGTDDGTSQRKTLEASVACLRPGGRLVLGCSQHARRNDLDLRQLAGLPLEPWDLPGMHRGFLATGSANGHLFIGLRRTADGGGMSVPGRVLSDRLRHDRRAWRPMDRARYAHRDLVQSRLDSGEYPLLQVPCPLCGAEPAIGLTQKDAWGLGQRTVLCLGCGAVYARDRLTPDALLHFFKEDYRRIDRGDSNPPDGFFEAEVAKGETIREFLRLAGWRPPPQARVLEIGCGAGGVLAAFRTAGCEVRGYDPDALYVAHGRDRHGLDLKPGGMADAARDLAGECRPVDLVVYEQTLGMIPDLAAELALIRQVLKPGGWLFVGVPALRNLEQHGGGDILSACYFCHVLVFEARSLSNFLARHGFESMMCTESVRGAFRLTDAAAAIRPVNPFEVHDYLRRVERRFGALSPKTERLDICLRMHEAGLRDLYRSTPGLAERPAAEQTDMLHRAARIGGHPLADVLAALRQSGIDAHAHISNARSMQTAWGRERGWEPVLPDDWQEETAAAQIDERQPRCLILVGDAVAGNLLRRLRQRPSRILVWASAATGASSASSEIDWTGVDLVLSADPAILRTARARGAYGTLPLPTDASPDVFARLLDDALREQRGG